MFKRIRYMKGQLLPEIYIRHRCPILQQIHEQRSVYLLQENDSRKHIMTVIRMLCVIQAVTHLIWHNWSHALQINARIFPHSKVYCLERSIYVSVCIHKNMTISVETGNDSVRDYTYMSKVECMSIYIFFVQILIDYICNISRHHVNQK